MRMKSEGFEPTTFEVYKVSGPNKFRKYFVSRKDAKSFIVIQIKSCFKWIKVTVLITFIKTMLTEIRQHPVWSLFEPRYFLFYSLMIFL